MTKKATTMFIITVVSAAFILIATSTEDVVKIIGNAGAGIVFILGLGFSFLIEQKEEK